MVILLEQVVQYILTGAIDYTEVSKVAHVSNSTSKKFSPSSTLQIQPFVGFPQVTDESLEGGHSDTKGAVAALNFFLVNSSKYDVGDTTLLLEVRGLS